MKALVDRKKIWKILNEGWTGTIFYIVLGLIIAVFVHWGLGIVLNTELPIVTVSSQSMVPTLNVGDIVFIEGEKNYSLGDIIVFKGWEKDPIIHRIVAFSDGNVVKKLKGWNELSDKDIKEIEQGKGKIYITKGDNNPTCDQCYGELPARESDVYGKEIFIIPYLGWIKILFVEYFIKKPAIGVGTVILLGGIYWIYKKKW